ncbi:MAG: DUF1211 domain-containing protein, partial [Hyphomicrobiales bacterium]|nr:DUF1211 domain-containing protein [Hyphomicrobiales bacterium]
MTRASARLEALPMHVHYNRIARSDVGRIEALSDGVFAFAATVLVLDFHSPDPALLRALAGSAPRLLPMRAQARRAEPSPGPQGRRVTRVRPREPVRCSATVGRAPPTYRRGRGRDPERSGGAWVRSRRPGFRASCRRIAARRAIACQGHPGSSSSMALRCCASSPRASISVR